MPRLLHLDSSADLTGSRSRAITAALAEAWSARGDDYEVVRRDLHTDPLPHLPHQELHWAAADRTAGTVVPGEWETLQRSIIDELLSVHAVVVGAPLYNYTVPSTLKVWLDCIHVPGVMFGPGSEPMAGRPAVVVSSRGAVYDAGMPTEGWDHGVPVLKIILGEALKMDVSVIQTSITLARRAPDLAGYVERSDQEFADALARARELGSSL